jgi:hypothetical protein
MQTRCFGAVTAADGVKLVALLACWLSLALALILKHPAGNPLCGAQSRLVVGTSNSILPSTLLVAASEEVISLAAPVITRTGACLVGVGGGNDNGMQACPPNSTHVFVYTTQLPLAIPPGIKVVYLKPPHLHAPCTMRTARQQATARLKQLATGTTQQSGDNGTTSAFVSNNTCLQAWATHYHHWRLLTRLWDNWAEVPVTTLCDANATRTFLGHTRPCDRHVYDRLASYGIDGNVMSTLFGAHTTIASARAELEAVMRTGMPRAALPVVSSDGVNATFMEYTDALPDQITQHTRLAWKPRRTINLLCTFFPSPNAKRAEELRVSLLGNINNPYVDSLHIFIDGNTTAAQVPISADQYIGRIIFVHMPQQPTYADLADYANRHLQGHIAVMMNADNVFTDAVQGFHHMAANQVFGLSRHASKDVAFAACHDHNHCLNYGGSFDAFGFVSPLPPEVVESLRYKQNLMGADVATVAVFRHFGYDVVNPCKDMVMLHNHCSGWRDGREVHPSLHNPPFGHAHSHPTTLAKNKTAWMYDTKLSLFTEMH